MHKKQVDRGERGGKQSENPAESTARKHNKREQQKYTCLKCKQTRKKRGLSTQKKHSINAHNISLQFCWRKQVLARPKRSTAAIFVSVPGHNDTGRFLAKQENAHPGVWKKNISQWKRRILSSFKFRFQLCGCGPIKTRGEFHVTWRDAGEPAGRHDVELVDQLGLD